MRILIVTCYSLPHIGGIQTLVDQEVRALASSGHTVNLVTSDAKTLASGPEYPHNVRTHRVGAFHFLESMFNIYYPIFSPSLIWVLWKEAAKSDAVHVHGVVFLSSIIGAIVAWLRGKPIILTEHAGRYNSSNKFASALAYTLEATIGRVTTRLATRLVAYSPAIIAFLERLANDNRKSLLLPRPVDGTLFALATASQKAAALERLGLANGKRKVLFVGRLMPDKGEQFLPSLCNEHYDLLVCSADNHGVASKAWLRNVFYFPPRPQPELVSLYHAADVLILPTCREGGLPLVAVEALACGLKVVMTDYLGSEHYLGVPNLYFCARTTLAIRKTLQDALESIGPCVEDRKCMDCEKLWVSLEEWIGSLYRPFSSSETPVDDAIGLPGYSAPWWDALPSIRQPSCQLSVVIPAYREAENLPVLVPRLANCLAKAGIEAEILIVDDMSQDGTEMVCKELAADYPVRLIVRTHERGLASAVLRGIREARGDVLVVMDADLSHPPEKVPELYDAIQDDDAEFVIGSRYVSGGATDENWGLFRWLNSKIATWLAWPLTSVVRDPMAGFFALRRSTYELAADQLDPVGYKIGLELMVKCECPRIKEVPIHFRDRALGTSKLNFKEQVNYLRHLRRLYAYRLGVLAQPIQFLFVGTTGMVVDLLLFAAFLFVMPAALARALAIGFAMTWNFCLNRELTFEKSRGRPVALQYLLFCSSCLAGALINWSISVYLNTNLEFFIDRPMLSGFVGVVSGTAINFFLSKYVVFSQDAGNAGKRPKKDANPSMEVEVNRNDPVLHV